MAVAPEVEARRQAAAAQTARVSSPLIELAGVEKTYRMGRLDYPALRGVGTCHMSWSS
jgi:hypothetical protein